MLRMGEMVLPIDSAIEFYQPDQKPLEQKLSDQKPIDQKPLDQKPQTPPKETAWTTPY